MVSFPSNCEFAEAGSASSKPILAPAYCLGVSFGQAFNIFPAEKPVPAVAAHALTFQAFDRKACSGSQPMVSNSHVPIPATPA
jgi:hypothetical protein